MAESSSCPMEVTVPDRVSMNREDFGLIDATMAGAGFPIALDRAWAWLGYSKKGNAVKALKKSKFIEGNIQTTLRLFITNFSEGVDFVFVERIVSRGALARDYFLSMRAFKMWTLRAPDKDKAEKALERPLNIEDAFRADLLQRMNHEKQRAIEFKGKYDGAVKEIGDIRHAYVSELARAIAVEKHEVLVRRGLESPERDTIPPTETEFLRISAVARARDVTLSREEMCRVGILAAKAYSDANQGSLPPKVDMPVGGTTERVNAYTDAHLPFIEGALQTVLDERQTRVGSGGEKRSQHQATIRISFS